MTDLSPTLFIPSMDTRAYPGKGLSPMQLVFALNEELKHMARPSSFTFDGVCQLDRDTLTALVTIREWRNSFVHINRIPPKVLSLISTHLPSKNDHFRATFVCRHWRRTFIQHTALWTELNLRKGEAYVKTLLERAKGSPLDIVSFLPPPIGTISLLPPHTKQIRSLNFACNRWAEVQRFSELTSGPFPLLHTLRIGVVGEASLDSPDARIPPSVLLFGNAVNLENFRLRLESSPFLNHFVFPNLTFFKLSITQVEGFRVSQLLDFLEASPTLRKVDMNIVGDILLDDIPRERAVVLPNLESLSLVVSGGEPGYNLVTHMSCPVVKHTSLTHRKDVDDLILYKIFPSPASWDAIVRRCTRSPVEEITLEIDTTGYTILTCSLTFQSPDETVIDLCFEVTTKNWNENEADFEMPLHKMYCGVLSQACRIIRDLPQPANVKCLHISHSSCISDYTWARPVTNKESLDTMVPPSRLLSGNAMDLQELQLHSKGSPLLNHFVAPNLTSFQLSVEQVEGFQASQLLNFLEASPMLQKADVEIVGDILLDDVPRERAVVLPSVESLSLAVSEGGPGYDLITHILCPIVERTSLTYKKDVDNLTLYNIFPSPALWNTIVGQYKRSPSENVRHQINMDQHTIFECALTFSSSDASTIRLCFEVTKKDRNKNEDDFDTPLHEIYCGVFSQAFPSFLNTPESPIARELGRLFESLGPLECLGLSCCDMRPYLIPSLTFPQIEHLDISYPLCPPHDDVEAIMVRLAESQHALGVPFEYVFIDMGERSVEVVKSLGLWVSEVYCGDKRYRSN